MHLDLRIHRPVCAAAHHSGPEDTLVRHDHLATRIRCPAIWAFGLVIEVPLGRRA
ncbi:hypothetical protein [Streptomyces massasporeus]|uniref:hypothetical protein n=1 Tax=Streptomyces massasporeus TaxID=67324 RepID=UPI0033DD6F0F